MATPVTTGMTRTSAGVAMLMWLRRGAMIRVRTATAPSAAPAPTKLRRTDVMAPASFENARSHVIGTTSPYRSSGTMESMTTTPEPSVDERDAVSPAGRFRIYMGAVAGVGKTFAMLDEGWRRHRRGADVVVGFVETHGRPRTAELIRDLEIVPRKVVEYRDSTFEEMDLDAVLARRPEVVLVDEL